MSNSIADMSAKQLRQAAKLKEKIAALQIELNRLVGDGKNEATRPKKRRKMSAAARKKISEAQKKRWANRK